MLDITIEAFSDDGYSSSVGTWKGAYTPDSLEINGANKFKTQESIGVSGPPVYYGEGKNNMTFPILVDNTYKASLTSPGAVKPIYKQVEALLKLVKNVNSESHKSNYLKITAGSFIFCGQTSNINVKYSFFNNDGEPQRAELKLTIGESETVAKQKADAGKKSPDLTRSVVVKEGDSLAGFSQKFYNTPHYYLQLGAFNGLKNIRALKVGTRLVIPPLES